MDYEMEKDILQKEKEEVEQIVQEQKQQIVLRDKLLKEALDEVADSKEELENAKQEAQNDMSEA